MRLLILSIVSLLCGSISGLSMAVDIKDDIYRLSDDINRDVYSSRASMEDLDLARQLLRRAKGLVRGQGNGGAVARATFVCNSSRYLVISLSSSTGSTANRQVFLGNPDKCQYYAQLFSQMFGRVRGMAPLAVCDPSHYLKRFALTSQGQVISIDSIYMGSSDRCDSHAQQVNAIGSIEQGAVATYLCEASRYLRISLTAASGATNHQSLYVGTEAICSNQVSELLNRHVRIEEFDIIAVCNPNELVKFSLYPDGSIRLTDRVYVGNPNLCLQQAEAINNGLKAETVISGTGYE